MLHTYYIKIMITVRDIKTVKGNKTKANEWRKQRSRCLTKKSKNYSLPPLRRIREYKTRKKFSRKHTRNGKVSVICPKEARKIKNETTGKGI